ncbi:hypothetical protein OC835_003551 [Tilletia horrida]|nr:hypothetical protein OC835_003551 [Tilletia horrida]
MMMASPSNHQQEQQMQQQQEQQQQPQQQQQSKASGSGGSPRKSKGSGGGRGGTRASTSSATFEPAEDTGVPEATGTSVFPTARMQRIIKSDEDLTNCSAEAAFLIAIATECFIKYFVEESYASARMEKRRAISYKDCQRAVQREWALGFLQEAVPPTMPLSAALKKAEAHEASTLRGIALSVSNAEGLKAGSGGASGENGHSRIGMEDDGNDTDMSDGDLPVVGSSRAPAAASTPASASNKRKASRSSRGSTRGGGGVRDDGDEEELASEGAYERGAAGGGEANRSRKGRASYQYQEVSDDQDDGESLPDVRNGHGDASDW